MSRLLPALALLALAGCATLGEVGELVAEGGSKTLREPMRPHTDGDRVLVIALDGVGEASLRMALASGGMPRLAALLGVPDSAAAAGADVWGHAAIAPATPSVFPAETAPGWAAVYTGQPPAVNGVTGNEWFDRDSLAVYAPVPLSVGTIEQTLKIWSDDLLGRTLAAPTLFERADVRAHVAMGFVYRGADLLTPPDLNDFGDLAEAAVQMVLGDADDAYDEIDDDTWEGVRRGVRRHGVPRLQVAYFPGVDLLTHDKGQDAQQEYLATDIDAHIGRILDLYAERGALADTWVTVVSDHGHTATLADSTHSLGGGDESEDAPARLVSELGYRLRDFAVGADSSDADAVMIYDEAVAMLYVADRSACPAAGDVCDWRRRPRLDADVLPLARGFARASATGDPVARLQGTLDLVLVRSSDPAGGAVPFRVLDGDRLVDVGDWLAAHDRPDLVDLERRLAWLTDGPLGHRAGDILLLARAGGDRPIEERFYFGSPRVSGHGSAAASDAHISLVVAHPGRTGAEVRARVRAAVGDRPTQLDVTPLILDLLGVDG